MTGVVVRALPLGEFTFAPDEAWPGQTGVVVAYAVRHGDQILVFDTGLPTPTPELEALYAAHEFRHRSIEDALAAEGIDLREVTAIANSHLHFDHTGQNDRFPDRPIYVQAAELAASTGPDREPPEALRFVGARLEVISGDHPVSDGLRLIATPGHSPGHQSLVVDSPDGPLILAGQAVYSRGEWIGIPGAREGASLAPDPEGYAASVARLRAIAPRRVLFGHDRQGWPD